jgi:hypothetical protein
MGTLFGAMCPPKQLRQMAEQLSLTPPRLAQLCAAIA